MGERDAFGRDVDEDPLAAMGWERPSGVAPAPRPAAATERRPAGDVRRAAGAAAARPRRRTRSRGRHRGAGVLVRVAVLGVLVAFFAGPVLEGVETVRDAVDESTQRPEAAPARGEGAREGAGAGAREGRGEGTREGRGKGARGRARAGRAEGRPVRDVPLTGRAAFGEALAALRELAAPEGRPVLLRVTAADVVLQVVTGGDIQVLRAARGDDATLLATTETASTIPAFAWDDIDAGALPALRRLPGFEAATLAGVPELRWTVQAGGGLWTAAPDGSGAERLGG